MNDPEGRRMELRHEGDKMSMSDRQPFVKVATDFGSARLVVSLTQGLGVERECGGFGIVTTL
jgi:hypothetical protein